MEKQTKTKILVEALGLFAEKGYSATSVQEIASAVGIKAPSLYNHFKSKKQIIDGIVEMMMNKFQTTFDAKNTANVSIEKQVKIYGDGGVELLKDTARYLFNYYLTDEYASQFKKMLSIEKYKDKNMDNLFTQIYIDEPIQYQTELFREMIKQNYMINANPEIMAYQFFSPILVLLEKYSSIPQRKEEAYLILDKHIEQFNKNYRKNI